MKTTLLACCRFAGFDDATCLCGGRPTPNVSTEVYALATDDAMHLTTCGIEVSRQRMLDLDEALLREGIEKHPGKDEVGVSDGTCI